MEDELKLTDSKCETLKRSLFEINREIGIAEVISCVFSTSSTERNHFEYYHKSHQEYLVALHLLNLLKRPISDLLKRRPISLPAAPQDFLISLIGDTDNDFDR